MLTQNMSVERECEYSVNMSVEWECNYSVSSEHERRVSVTMVLTQNMSVE